MTRWFYVSIVLTAVAWLGFGYLAAFPETIRFDKVPVHWDINMQPDGFVTRADAWHHLIIYPSVMTGMLLLCWLLPWLSPKNFEVESFRATYEYIFAVIVGLFVYLGMLHVLAITTDLGMPARAFVGGFFLLFALIAHPMTKVRRNFWIGVRTPWTLASDTVWTRTHHLAAWLWLAAGIGGFLGVLAGVPWWPCFAVLITAVLYPVLHSLILYKSLQRQGKLEA